MRGPGSGTATPAFGFAELASQARTPPLPSPAQHPQFRQRLCDGIYVGTYMCKEVLPKNIVGHLQVTDWN
jgi:hypothetical protein